MQMMQSFSLKMNKKQKVFFLYLKSESRAMVNVDLRQGSLLSMPNLQHLEQALGAYFVQFADMLFYYNNWRAIAYMDNKMYWADGVETGKVMEDGTELALGLPTPSTSCTLKAVDLGIGKHRGDFKYTYTFYSTQTNTESAPAPLPLYLVVDEDNIQVSGLEALPADADRYRIYRIGGYLPRFTMVDEIENTETPYTDSLDDTEMDGRLLQTMRAGYPIQGINHFVELNGRLFGSVGTRVYYSALGNPDAWYSSDFYVMPETITGLAKSSAGLLVFGKRFTYRLVGTMPQNFRLKVISNELGCVSAKSIAYHGDKAIWLGLDGIYTTDGYQLINLTGNKIQHIANLSPTSAILYNDTYYLHYKPELTPLEDLYPRDNLYPSGALGVNELEDGIISMDFKRGRGYSYGLLNFDGVASLGIKDGLPHSITSTANVVFLSCEDPIECDDYLQCSQYDLNLMGDRHVLDYATLSYISPQFIDGSFSTLKQYEKIRVNVLGDFNVKVMFSNGDVVVEQDIKTADAENTLALLSGEEISFDRDSVELIGIPNNDNFSYSIAFIIEGVGIIKSIQYSWKNRELP